MSRHVTNEVALMHFELELADKTRGYSKVASIVTWDDISHAYTYLPHPEHDNDDFPDTLTEWVALMNRFGDLVMIIESSYEQVIENITASRQP
jgi:hypothetical protein